MDTTTTDIEPILPDDETSQSGIVADEAAAQQPAEPTQTEDKGPSEDENLAWLQKKGIDPSSPEALAKVAEMYRNAEKTMHQSTQKASELEKTLSGAESAPATDNELVNQLHAEVQGLKLSQNVQSFFAENPDAKALEGEMAKAVQERPDIGQLVKAGYLTIGDLYNLVRGGDPSRDEKLKADGGREALEKVASKQQAKAVPGVATTSDFSTKEEDAFLSAFDKA